MRKFWVAARYSLAAYNTISDVIFRTLLTLTVKPRGGHHAVVVSIGDALGLRDTLGAVRGSG